MTLVSVLLPTGRVMDAQASYRGYATTMWAYWMPADSTRPAGPLPPLAGLPPPSDGSTSRNTPVTQAQYRDNMPVIAISDDQLMDFGRVPKPHPGYRRRPKKRG